MESLAHILRTSDIMVHMHPHKKICDLLVAPTDIIDKMEQAGVIKAVKCGGCVSRYVDEIGCPLKKRMMEHYRDSSPVSQHAKGSRYQVNYDQVKVLDCESGWFRWGVKESIHIITSPSDLNQDKGHYTLLRVYHTLLHIPYLINHKCDLVDPMVNESLHEWYFGVKKQFNSTFSMDVIVDALASLSD